MVLSVLTDVRVRLQLALQVMFAASALALLLTACGGSGGSSDGTAGSASTSAGTSIAADSAGAAGVVVAATIGGSVDSNGNPVASAGDPVATVLASQADRPTSKQDAVRLLDQAGFGGSDALVASVMQQGPHKYLSAQFAQPASRYVYTLPANASRDQVHTTSSQDFCGQFTGAANTNCWRDWSSTLPVQWDFFRQAAGNDDQLRQRVAFALSQMFVVSGLDINGTYGMADYQQRLRDYAFSDFRSLLRKVMLSPVMGTYLNMVNNDGTDPNENFARELLQLFSLGTCMLNKDGTLAGGQCAATYDNTMVRNYAYALSGWTYPTGGVNPWCSNCQDWRNPTYLRGDMVAVSAKHDPSARSLLSGVSVGAGTSPAQAVEAVLDSILAHPNLAPFIGKQLIQHLVTSNPSPAYVARVSTAFNAGTYNDGVGSFGTGTRGDMQATLAAILMDSEARDAGTASTATYGRLRDPVQYVLHALRALNGITDGDRLGIWGGSAEQMGQPIFNSPSVFNFYAPDFPLPKSTLVAPQFGISNANTALARINFANDLIFWWYNKGQGLEVNTSLPNATGTKVSYATWEAMLVDANSNSGAVVDRLSDLLTAGRLSSTDKQAIVTAMAQYSPTDTWLTNSSNVSTWQRERVKTAVYLMLSSPQYQVQR